MRNSNQNIDRGRYSKNAFNKILTKTQAAKLMFKYIKKKQGNMLNMLRVNNEGIKLM